MNDLRIDPHLPTTPSQQLIDGVLDEVAAGRLSPGDRLPSVRRLAASALVNPNTVSKAYRALELLGVVEGRNGLGVFVTHGGPEIARERRCDATLEQFAAAAAAAMRAGHPLEDLQRILTDGAYAEVGSDS